MSPSHQDIPMDKLTAKLILFERGTSAKKQSEEAGWRRSREITLFEFAFRSKIMEHVCSDIPLTLSLTCSFIYGCQQRIHISLPQEKPCHIYIFLIAHNSNSPGLTCPIKKIKHFARHLTFSLKPGCPITSSSPLLHKLVYIMTFKCMCSKIINITVDVQTICNTAC